MTKKFALILISISFLHPIQIFAEEELPTLDPLIVTATRTDERRMDVPNTTRWIDDQQLVDKGFRTLPEAFQETPGMMVQKTANGQGSPFILGFTGFRNLLLIDGVRLNHSAFREGPNQYWNTVDAFSLQGIEVVPGQGSVLYGSDAIGGTVNALTKGPDLLAAEAGEGFSSGRALYRWSSGEQSHIGRVEGWGCPSDR